MTAKEIYRQGHRDGRVQGREHYLDSLAPMQTTPLIDRAAMERILALAAVPPRTRWWRA